MSMISGRDVNGPQRGLIGLLIGSGLILAFGLLAADVRDVAVRSVVAPADAATWLRVRDLFAELTLLGDAALAEQAVPRAARTFVREVDLRYVGQSTELAASGCEALEEAIEAFHRRHEQRYGFCTREEAVEIVTVRVIAIGATPKPRLVPAEIANARAPKREALLERRSVYDGVRFTDTPVYARELLAAGNVFDGPAVVEQYDATTYGAAGWSARIDAIANLVIART